jgi:hypothetical protein
VVVSQWCLSGVSVVLQWCCSGVAVVLQRVPGVACRESTKGVSAKAGPKGTPIREMVMGSIPALRSFSFEIAKGGQGLMGLNSSRPGSSIGSVKRWYSAVIV